MEIILNNNSEIIKRLIELKNLETEKLLSNLNTIIKDVQIHSYDISKVIEQINEIFLLALSSDYINNEFEQKVFDLYTQLQNNHMLILETTFLEKIQNLILEKSKVERTEIARHLEVVQNVLSSMAATSEKTLNQQLESKNNLEKSIYDLNHLSGTSLSELKEFQSIKFELTKISTNILKEVSQTAETLQEYKARIDQLEQKEQERQKEKNNNAFFSFVKNSKNQKVLLIKISNEDKIFKEFNEKGINKVKEVFKILLEKKTSTDTSYLSKGLTFFIAQDELLDENVLVNLAKEIQGLLNTRSIKLDNKTSIKVEISYKVLSVNTKEKTLFDFEQEISKEF